MNLIDNFLSAVCGDYDCFYVKLGTMSGPVSLLSLAAAPLTSLSHPRPSPLTIIGTAALLVKSFRGHSLYVVDMSIKAHQFD